MICGAERSAFVTAGKVLAYENGIRFLTDYLRGDVYFRVHHETQNLDRARAQFAVARSLERQEEDLLRRMAPSETAGITMPGDLVLLPRADRRVRLGHAWVFSNEIDIGRSPLTAFSPGDFAVVRDSFGKPVGTAYVNPGSLICARILTSDAKARIDQAWWSARIRRAFALRESIYPTPHYRAVYGESDGCPGLVVDRYGDILVAQLNTAGIVKMRDPVLMRRCKP